MHFLFLAIPYSLQPLFLYLLKLDLLLYQRELHLLETTFIA